MQFVPVVDINQRYLMLTTPSKARGWMKKIGHTLVIFFVVLLLTLTSPLLGIAQNPTQPENKIDGFPVMLDGKTLFFIRRGVSSFSAEERANTITRRIERIAQNDSIPIENLTIEQIPDDNSLYLSVDQEVILTVTERDAKAYRSTPEVLAQQALQKIQVISGKLFPFIRRLIESLTPGIQIGNIEIVSSSKISFFWLRVLRMIRLFILFLLTFNYATFVLRLFPWTRVFGESILGYFSRSLELVLSSIGKYLPNAFIIAIIIFVTYYLIRLIKPFFTAIERGNLVIPGFYTDWAKPTYNLLLVIIITLAAIVAFPMLLGELFLSIPVPFASEITFK